MQFSVATIALPTLTPDECVLEAVGLGLGGIEWRVEPRVGSIPDRVPAHPYLRNNLATIPLDTAAAAAIGDLTRAAGLEIPGLGAYVELGDLETLRLVAEMTRAAGAAQFRLQAPRSTRTGLPYRELFTRFHSFFEDIAEVAAEFGVRASLEIHHNTICCSAALAFRVLEGFDPAHVGAIYDTGNLVFEGFQNHEDALDLLGPYLAHVHIKNAAHLRSLTGVWKPEWTPLDDGEIDIDAFLTLLSERNYAGWVSLEDLSLTRSPVETLRYDTALLRAWGHHSRVR
jgi:sugar phosphate isomerase/epimerase